LAVVFFQYRTSITSRFLRWRRIFSHTGKCQFSWCLEYFSFFSPFSFTTEDISRLVFLFSLYWFIRDKLTLILYHATKQSGRAQW
jgi:hypothetical protein